MNIPFDNQYAALGGKFSEPTRPAVVAGPELIKLNEKLAAELGLPLDGLDVDDAAAIFSGNRVPEGAEPVAMAYAGHQFGHFVPQLGDGRAILLGEIRAPDGRRFDIHLKGSGRTFFSRGGDGRAALGPVLREYLVSEAMAKLGVPTTRALAAVTTGEQVMRERPLPGAVITRVASSLVRVGTFQYFAARGDVDAIRQLADYVIERNYPAAAEADNPYVALLDEVVARQASLIARWMQLGFIHGVMNTDNMSLAGETIDYGPCAFMDAYAHDRVFSSIDQGGRYAYGNQPSIGLWNLTRLAETLLPLFADDTEAAVEIAQDVLGNYATRFTNDWVAGMRAKCGLSGENGDAAEGDDKLLVEALLDAMAAGNADYTLTFYHLSQLDAEPNGQDQALRELFEDAERIDEWLVAWRKRLGAQDVSDAARRAGMRASNPVYIPRNHRIEAAIRAAEDRGDFSLFHDLNDVLQQPYERQQGRDAYMLPPEPHEIVAQTFCGT